MSPVGHLLASSFADADVPTVDPSTGDGTGIDGTTNRNFPPIFSCQVDRVSSISSGCQDLGEVCNANEPRTVEFRGRMPPVLDSHVDSGARSLHALGHMTREADAGLIHGAARRAGSTDPDSG